MARRRGRTSLAAIVSSVRAVEPLPVAVVATAPADGGGVEWSEVGRSGVLRHGMVCCAVLWWWKLCVFLCHIPIYINLVFAMTDDICQCQTFSFSISASPAAAAVVPAGKDVQVLAPFGLKVTFPKVSAQRPRPQNILHFSLFKLPAPAPAGRRPTHEFDEFDVKYFCCFPHSFFYEKHFLGIRIGFWARLPRALACH